MKFIYTLKQSLGYLFINSIISNLFSRQLRILLYKLAGMKIGKNVSMYRKMEVRGAKGISIGENVSIGPKVLLDGRKGLRIGNNVTIAYEAIIWSLHHDMNDSNFCGKGEKTEIDDYAWVCSRAIILPGVKIGYGAVVASGAVVTKNVEPFDIVGGIPARVIGKRDKKEYHYSPYTELFFV